MYSSLFYSRTPRFPAPFVLLLYEMGPGGEMREFAVRMGFFALSRPKEMDMPVGD